MEIGFSTALFELGGWVRVEGGWVATYHVSSVQVTTDDLEVEMKMMFGTLKTLPVRPKICSKF